MVAALYNISYQYDTVKCDIEYNCILNLLKINKGIY